jgi:hypothetical protein
MIWWIFIAFAPFVSWVKAVAFKSSILSPYQIVNSSAWHNRGLQIIDKSRYNVTFVEASVTNSTFRISFNNGAGDGKTPIGGRFEIFTAREGVDAEADQTLSCFSTGGELFRYEDPGSGISNASMSLVANSVTTPSTFNFSFDGNVAESSPFYYGGSGTTTKQAKYIFCVKFTLSQDIPGPASTSTVDINYREVGIEVSITLDGGLDSNSVGAFEVDAGPKNTSTENEVVYTASAGLCSTYDLDTAIPQQGEVIPVCIISDDYPLARMVEVLDLVFSSGDLTQAIRSDGGDAPGAMGLYGLPDPLNADHCRQGECVQYDVTLYAIFVSEVEASLEISITGNVILGIGASSRLLRAHFKPTRELQEAFREQAFSTTIEIPALRPAQSTAATLRKACLLASLFAAAMVSVMLF